MANYSVLNDYLRNYIDIQSIAEYIGLPLRPTSSAGMFCIGQEKAPSFHLVIRDGVQIFHYHGKTYPIEEYLHRAGKPEGAKSQGGNPIDFAVFALQYACGEVARVYDHSNAEAVAKGMTALTEFLKGVSPSIDHLIPEPRNNSTSAFVQQTIPSIRPTNMASVLSGFIDHSGGAIGTDIELGNLVKANGGTVHHYYIAGSQHIPRWADTPISNEDITAGATCAAQAAARMYDYKYQRMKDALIIRDYTQMKNADAIFAFSKLAAAGEKFDPRKDNDDRICKVDTVIGGTGYCVNMAIIANKPVYVFNQDDNLKFKRGWYRYDYKAGTYVPCELPILTKNFAGIGTRQPNEFAIEAMKALVENTVKYAIAQGAQQTQHDAAVDEPWRSQVETSTPVNIYAGSGDNPELSNFAYRPFFIEGHFFLSVEQFFQWKKACLCGDSLTSAKILALSGEGIPAGMDKKEFNDVLSMRKEIEERLPIEKMAELEEFITHKVSPACFRLGREAKGYDSVRERWEGEERTKALAFGIHLSFLHNVEAQKTLIETGNSLLTHKGSGRTTWSENVFPELLMKERYYLTHSNIDGIGGKLETKKLEVIAYERGVHSRDLVDYLKGRGFNKATIAKSFYEVTYRWQNPDGTYTAGKKAPFRAIATPGINGESWSVVIPSLEVKKRSAGPQCIAMFDKNYNYITGVSEGQLPHPSSKICYVFEGQMNAPSMFQIQGKPGPLLHDVITLNSVSMLNMAIPILKQYSVVMFCFDNDKAGQKATETAAMELLSSGVRCFDVRPVFVNNKPMLPLELLHIVKVKIGEEEKYIPSQDYNKESHGDIITERELVCISTGDRNRHVSLAKYWEPILGKGPINDYNDTLKVRMRLAPTPKNKSAQLPDGTTINLKP